MRKLVSLLVAVACLAVAASAHANTAADALNVGFNSADIYRPAGQALSSGVGWMDKLPDSAPVAATSSAQVNWLMTLAGQSAGKHWRGNRAIYTVDSSTPYSTVCLRHAVDGSFAGWKNYMGAHEVLMTTKVPVPTGAIPFLDGGGDQGMTIWYPDADQLWEFYQFRQELPGGPYSVDQQGRKCDYSAAVGQRMLTVGPHAKGYRQDGSSYTITYPATAISPGYFRNNPTGTYNAEYRDVARAASKLPTMFGTISTDEWNNPSEVNGFGHKLAGQLPLGNCKVTWPAYSPDATCYGDPTIGHGAVLRLKPGTNCQRGDSSLAWRRARAMCVTFRDYGWISDDQTGNGWSYYTLDATNKHVADGHDNASNPNWYIEAFWDVFKANLEVLAAPPGKHDWTPGCSC